MTAISKEFHEELGWIYVPKTIAQILIDVSKIDDFPRKVMILEFHVRALEEEMRRIDGFTCHLPHCTHFLEDATEIMKQEILRWKKGGKYPVMEEFMPLESGLEGSSRAKGSKDINEKKEWMSSVQLWTTPVQYENNLDQDKDLHHKSSCRGDQASGSGGRSKHKGGANVPINMKNKGVVPASSSSAESEVARIDLNVTAENPRLQEPRPEPLPKKQRRCWSPQLHRQFIDALQQLGGGEAATPKQIREVMNVEGITNDEIKSHLQATHSKASLFGKQQLSHSWVT